MLLEENEHIPVTSSLKMFNSILEAVSINHIVKIYFNEKHVQ